MNLLNKTLHQKIEAMNLFQKVADLQKKLYPVNITMMLVKVPYLE